MTLLLVNVNFKLWILRTALLTNHHFLDLLFLLFPACLPQQQSCRSIISWDIWTTCQCVMDSQGHACLLYHPSWFVHASSLVNLIFDSAQQEYFCYCLSDKKNTQKKYRNDKFLYRKVKPKTRPSSDSEAATMYKLKGKSSNMQTGQGFKKKNWSVQLVCPAGPSSWYFSGSV